MTDNHLKRLNRKELLELLLKATEEMEKLQARVTELTETCEALEQSLAEAEAQKADALVQRDALENYLAEAERSREEAEEQLDGMAAEQEELLKKTCAQLDRLLQMSDIMAEATARLDRTEARLQDAVRQQNVLPATEESAEDTPCPGNALAEPKINEGCESVPEDEGQVSAGCDGPDTDSQLCEGRSEAAPAACDAPGAEDRQSETQGEVMPKTVGLHKRFRIINLTTKIENGGRK